jgi:helix-hairpin-helix protein
MPTPGERRALIFISALAAFGIAVRGCADTRGTATGGPLVAGDRAGLARQIAAVDSAIAAGGEKRKADRGRGAKDAATATPPKARGPRPNARPGDRPPERDAPPPQRLRARALAALPEVPAVAPRPQPTPSRQGTLRVPQAPVDLDTAPMEAIASLAQVGPALARRIVMDRIERGPFGSIGGLERVRGITRGLARRLQPYVTFSLASRLESVPEASVPVRTKRRP